jgi:hypothetical protein
MKKIQYNYLPADSAAAVNLRESKKGNQAVPAKTIPPPDEDTVARLNAMAREYPYCAWGKVKNNNLL